MRTKKKITMMRRIPKLSPTNELSRSLKRRKKITKPDYKLWLRRSLILREAYRKSRTTTWSNNSPRTASIHCTCPWMTRAVASLSRKTTTSSKCRTKWQKRPKIQESYGQTQRLSGSSLSTNTMKRLRSCSSNSLKRERALRSWRKKRRRWALSYRIITA